MKTTIEISDPLLHEARDLAAKEGVTLRTLVERGLRRVVGEMPEEKAFRLRRASFTGQGLQPSMEDASWETLREMSYKGRGG